MFSRLSGTDQAHPLAYCRMRHDQQPTATGAAEGQPSELSDRMVRIKKRDCQWIAEDSRGILETEAMLGFIAP